MYKVSSGLNGELYIAERVGDCIRLTIPATTENDWNREEGFITLPLMNLPTFNQFRNIVNEFADTLAIP